MQKQKSTFSVKGLELTGYYLLPDNFEGNYNVTEEQK